MHPIAQTTPALFGQLLHGGWDDDTLGRVRRAVELAAGLTTGRYRASGKPFLCHLIGTASALAAAGANVDTVIAGLLHAAYIEGEWGDGIPRMGRSKRRRLRRAIGAAAEERVARYTRGAWNPAVVADLRVGRLDPVERDVLAMRLANEVDDHLDLGVLFGKAASERRALARQALPDWVRLARELGLESLAGALAATVEPTLAREIPTVLHTGRWRSYLLAPRSHRPRVAPFLGGLAASADERLRRLWKRLDATLRRP